ncbi:MAG: PIN domain-containing protein [Thermoplasmata archaeon]
MSGSAVLVDTNVFVSARNRQERGCSACRELLDRIDNGELQAIVSTVTIAELRVGVRPQDVPTFWRAILTHLLTSANFRVEPVGVDIAEAAGELRATFRLTLPDALIVATGRLAGASCLVTQDTALATQQRVLPVRAPSDAA